MDDVVKMYAMSDGNPDIEPDESSADHDDFEEDEVERALSKRAWWSLKL